MGFELTTLVVICTDCVGSCKSNYHTTTTTIPFVPIETILNHGKENIRKVINYKNKLILSFSLGMILQIVNEITLLFGDSL